MASMGICLVLMFGVSGFRFSVLDGHSMTPTIPEGSLIVISVNFDPNNISIRSIISWRYNSTLNVLHRIIAVEGGKYITQGDNNSWPGLPVAPSQVIGVYVATLW